MRTRETTGSFEADASLRAYLDEIREIPLLTRSEEHRLCLRLAAGDMEARETLIAANLRLVVSIAKRYAGRGHTLIDLVGEGNIGLIKAIEVFDAAAGVKLSTYATWWIRQSIARAIDGSGSVRVPTHMRKLVARWRRAEAQLWKALGRQPATAEIAAALPKQVSPAVVLDILRALDAMSGPDTGEYGAEGATLGEVVSETDDRGGEDIVEAAAAVEDMLRRANDPSVAKLVRLRYGLNRGAEPMTTKQLAARLGVSAPTAAKLEAEAMARLREVAASQ